MSIPDQLDADVQGYVCGFCFDERRETVLLVEKERPAWQAGRFNGIGGKIEPGESPADAMTREFREEAGVTLPQNGPAADAWTPFCLLSWEPADAPGDDAGQVVFFRAVSSRAIRDAETMETEPIRRIALRDVLRPGMTRRKCLPNLRWLIPLALDPDATVVHGRIGGTLTPTGAAGQ